MHAQLLGDRAVTSFNGQMRMEEGAEDFLQEVSFFLATYFITVNVLKLRRLKNNYFFRCS